MNSRKVKRALENQAKLTNLIIGISGLLLVLTAILLRLSAVLQNILLSVGCSLIATSIATWMTSYYVIHTNEIREMVSVWRLKDLFRTKAEMNLTANQCLDDAQDVIDIIAIGMTGFLSVKGDILKKKALSGTKIRIISCENLEMLLQREKDETISGGGSVVGTMKNEVIALSEWVENLAHQKGSVSIKYHSTYPGFSYLRIDDNIFFGPNLPLYKSQLNFAMQFDIDGEGGKYFASYFDALWENHNICSDKLAFVRKETTQ